MATVVHALTSKAKVKSFLGITDSNSDAIIDELISYITDFVESMCGRRFIETVYSNEVHDSKRQQDLFLRNYPIASVSAVEYRSGTYATPVWVTYTTEHYLLYGAEGFIHFAGKLPHVPQGVRASYTAGYKIDWSNELNLALHTLPFDVAMVATELAANLLETRKNQGVQSMSTEGQSVTLVDVQKQVTQKQISVLSKYKAYRI